MRKEEDDSVIFDGSLSLSSTTLSAIACGPGVGAARTEGSRHLLRMASGMAKLVRICILSDWRVYCGVCIV